MAKRRPEKYACDFEQPIVELDARIAELQEQADNGDAECLEQIESLVKQRDDLIQQVHAQLTPYQRVKLARHPLRPQPIDYAGEIQTVHIFDFVHTEEETGFHQASVRIRIRLLDSWRQVLRTAGFSRFNFFGDWHGTPYSKESSRRLIAVAVK